MIFVLYETLSVITFLIIDKRQPVDSDTVMKWRANYQAGCGKDMDMTYSL